MSATCTRISIYIYIHIYMNMQTPSILMHMSAYTCPTQQHSARYSVMANIDACVAQVLPFVLHHDGPERWTPRNRRDACGQSCPCCRSRVIKTERCCEQCFDAWTLTQTCTAIFAATKQHAVLEKRTRPIKCGVRAWYKGPSMGHKGFQRPF